LMSDDCDSRFRFRDNQGNDFDVWASNEREAWSLAQRTIAAHDAANSQRGGALSLQGSPAFGGSARLPNIPWGSTDEAALGMGEGGGAVANSANWRSSGAGERQQRNGTGSIAALLALVLIGMCVGAVLIELIANGEIVKIP
jgi:hypothetical protein